MDYKIQNLKEELELILKQLPSLSKKLGQRQYCDAVKRLKDISAELIASGEYEPHRKEVELWIK